MRISLNIKTKNTQLVATNISPHETVTMRRREPIIPQLASRTLRATQCRVACGDICNKKRILTLSLAKPRHNAEVILRNCKLFIYIDASYINNSFCKTF